MKQRNRGLQIALVFTFFAFVYAVVTRPEASTTVNGSQSPALVDFESLPRLVNPLDTIETIVVEVPGGEFSSTKFNPYLDLGVVVSYNNGELFFEQDAEVLALKRGLFMKYKGYKYGHVLGISEADPNNAVPGITYIAVEVEWYPIPETP